MRRRARRRCLWTAHDLALVAALARKWAYLLNAGEID